MRMDDDDFVLRNLTYALFVDLCPAPTAAEVAGAADLAERRSGPAEASVCARSRLLGSEWRYTQM